MNTNAYSRILAIDPCHAGFGFAVLEGGRRLLDWGVAQVWSKADAALLNRVEQMVDRYKPALVVLEATAGSRLGRVAQRKIKVIYTYAEGRGLQVLSIPRKRVQASFAATGGTKHQVATAIADAFPELRAKLPPPRRPWMNEDERMHIFDALALVLALPLTKEYAGGPPRQ